MFLKTIKGSVEFNSYAPLAFSFEVDLLCAFPAPNLLCTYNAQIIYAHLILGLGAKTQFTICLEPTVSAPFVFLLNKPSPNWLPLITRAGGR